MAKKPRTGNEPEGGDAQGEGGKSGKAKLILIGAIGFLVLAGGGFYFLSGANTAEAEKGAKKPVTFVDIREMMINLAPEPNQERTRFLKFKVSLEVGDPEDVSKIQPLLPRVEDAFQVFVRELRSSDLEGSAGVYRLREELLRRVNISIYPAKADAVLFKEMVVQ